MSKTSGKIYVPENGKLVYKDEYENKDNCVSNYSLINKDGKLEFVNIEEYYTDSFLDVLVRIREEQKIEKDKCLKKE